MATKRKRPGDLEIAGAKAEPRHSEDDKEPMGKHSTPTIDLEAICKLNGLPMSLVDDSPGEVDEYTPGPTYDDFTDDELAEVRAKWDAAIVDAASKPRPLGWFAYEGIAAVIPQGRTSAGLRECFAYLGVAVRYNVRQQAPELHHESTGWVAFNDRLRAFIRDTIAERFGLPPKADESPRPLKFGRDAFNDYLNSLLYERAVDPFLLWLESLPRWDRVDRLSFWLTDLFEIPERPELAEWAGRFVFLGAVWRGYEPGTKLDETPVLIGRGGIGKSTCLRMALPDDQQASWFSDSLHLADDPKVRAESLQGRVLVEAAEMAGSTRAELESLKSFLSRTDDGAIRLAFRRDPEMLLRRCVIIGTADKLHVLPNDRNLRRFCPVRLHDGDPARVRRYMADNRAQLWAEALHLYRRGAEARLPSHLVGVQRQATEEHRSRDVVIEDAIAAWVTDHPDSFTLGQLASGIGLVAANMSARLNMRDQHRIGQVLESMGYTKRRTRQDGRRSWMWSRG